MSYIYTFKFEDDDTEKTFDVEVELVNNYEPNYGADADGRRGVAMDFVEIEDFKVFFDGLEITLPEILKRAEAFFDRYHNDKACEECAEAYHEDSVEEYDVLD